MIFLKKKKKQILQNKKKNIFIYNFSDKCLSLICAHNTD